MNSKKLLNYLNENSDYVELNMNDTFSYGCAESVMVSLQELPGLIHLEELYGYEGTLAFSAIKEDADPLTQLINDNYWNARKYIEENFISACNDTELLWKKVALPFENGMYGYVDLEKWGNE